MTMTDILTADNIASVSLKDADRDPTPSPSSSAAASRNMASPSSPTTASRRADRRAEEKAKAFFALPEEVKRKYALGRGGARGYTPFGIETAKGHKAHDLKEFWHVGRELAAGHPFRDVMATMSGRRKCRASRTPSSSCTTRSTAPASRS
jgi:hypothetical protein